MKAGDLVMWPQGYCDVPGIVIETRSAKGTSIVTGHPEWPGPDAINPHGLAVLAMLPELENDPEWFHECELEVINESR
jgi:hypothetical protein